MELLGGALGRFVSMQAQVYIKSGPTVANNLLRNMKPKGGRIKSGDGWGGGVVGGKWR